MKIAFCEFASNLVSLSSAGAGGGPLEDVNFTRIMLKLKNTDHTDHTEADNHQSKQPKDHTETENHHTRMISNFENQIDPAEAETNARMNLILKIGLQNNNKK